MAFCLNALEGHAEGIRVADGSLVIYAWGEVIFGSPMRAAFFRCRHRTGR